MFVNLEYWWLNQFQNAFYQCIGWKLTSTQHCSRYFAKRHCHESANGIAAKAYWPQDYEFFWSTENSHAIVEKSMNPQGPIMIWCGFWLDSNIGPYFFENYAVATATVNGKRYHVVLPDWFIDKIEAENTKKYSILTSGATCLASHSTIDILRLIFENWITSTNSDVNYHLRCWELTLLSYFLCGTVKKIIHDLDVKIHVAIAI